MIKTRLFIHVLSPRTAGEAHSALPTALLQCCSIKGPNVLTLVNDQLYAQFFYFIIRLLQSSTCFEQRRAHHQEVKLY